jgi:SAM-dependent methyltransferase
MCPDCGSLERHRALKLWFDGNSNIFHSASVLHFAPEACVTRFIKPAAMKYATADLEVGRGDLTLNIERIDLPDKQFEIIICSHVLEHVDDRAALRELRRIVKNGGRLILMVPIIEGWTETYENSALSGEADRTLYYGSNDHLRFYGADFREKVEGAGLALTEFTAVEPHVAKYGLLRGEKVFVAYRGDENDIPFSKNAYQNAG